ncbi:transposase domain-containing protein [Actinacidiphila glaucinigra]|uniref:transposase domain-containing protein n=1 Tax=Actinacidiphila glaucinigra TaxID=235986 RepID=UPI0038699D57
MGAQSAIAAYPPATNTGRPASARRPRRALESQFGDQIRLGVLTAEISPEEVDEVLELTGRVERRRRLLSARAAVYFVLALCLFSSSDSAGPPGYRVVLRTLTEKLRHLPGGIGQRLPTSSALTRARQRLGDKPLQALFERRCGARATHATPGDVRFRSAAGRLGRHRAGRAGHPRKRRRVRVHRS